MFFMFLAIQMYGHQAMKRRENGTQVNLETLKNLRVGSFSLVNFFLFVEEIFCIVFVGK